MTMEEAKRAAVLVEAYEGLADVLEGLRIKNVETKVWLEISAFDGDHDGGCNHGNSLIPIDLGPEIIDRVKDLLGDELAKLGVDVQLEPGAEEIQ